MLVAGGSPHIGLDRRLRSEGFLFVGLQGKFRAEYLFIIRPFFQEFFFLPPIVGMNGCSTVYTFCFRESQV